MTAYSRNWFFNLDIINQPLIKHPQVSGPESTSDHGGLRLLLCEDDNAQHLKPCVGSSEPVVGSSVTNRKPTGFDVWWQPFSKMGAR